MVSSNGLSLIAVPGFDSDGQLENGNLFAFKDYLLYRRTVVPYFNKNEEPIEE